LILEKEEIRVEVKARPGLDNSYLVRGLSPTKSTPFIIAGELLEDPTIDLLKLRCASQTGISREQLNLLILFHKNKVQQEWKMC
jgi:hypothetical protein